MKKNYQKLYLVKVMEELGNPVILNINDEAEWAGMQNIIKKVIKEIKGKKRKFVEDLDFSSIDGIKVVDPRFFKLDQDLVQILSSKYFEDSEDVEQIDLQESINNEEEINPIIEPNPIPVLPVEPITDTTLNQPMIEPIEITVEQPINETVEQPVMDPIGVSPIDPVVIEQTVLEPIKPIEVQNVDPVKETKTDEIDYKALYLAEKEKTKLLQQPLKNYLIN